MGMLRSLCSTPSLSGAPSLSAARDLMISEASNWLRTAMIGVIGLDPHRPDLGVEPQHGLEVGADDGNRQRVQIAQRNQIQQADDARAPGKVKGCSQGRHSHAKA